MGISLKPAKGGPSLGHFYNERIVIGRELGCDMVISSPAISRRHCVIQELEGEFILYDLGSKNGTWHNGTAIERTVLASGDQITLGNYALTFETVPDPAQQHLARTWALGEPLPIGC